VSPRIASFVVLVRSSDMKSLRGIATSWSFPIQFPLAASRLSEPELVGRTVDTVQGWRRIMRWMVAAQGDRYIDSATTPGDLAVEDAIRARFNPPPP
jgi:hypothetical protein